MTDIGEVGELVKIDGNTIEEIKKSSEMSAAKLINMFKRIETVGEENSDDPYLVAMAERARMVQESFEQRQTSTAEALDEILAELARNEARKKEQAERGFDGLTYFVFKLLDDAGIGKADEVSTKIRNAFTEFPNWKKSEASLRDLRKKVTFAIYAECDDLNQVTGLVDNLFRILEKGDAS